MADVREYFSNTAQEKSEANDVQMIASQKKGKRKCYIFFSSGSSSTDTDSEPVNKHSQQNSIFTSLRKLLALVALKFIPSPNSHQLSPHLTGV